MTYKTQCNIFITYRFYISIFIARLPIHAPFTLDICPKIGGQEHVLYIKSFLSIYGDSMGPAPYLHLPQGALSFRAVVTNVSQSVTCQISKYCYRGATLKVPFGYICPFSILHRNIDSRKRIPKLFICNLFIIISSVTFNYKNINIFFKL